MGDEGTLFAVVVDCGGGMWLGDHDWRLFYA